MSELAVCTIITKSYLPYARALAKSFKKHNPYLSFYVLLADRVDGYFDPSLEDFKFIYLEDLSDRVAVERMCFYYTPFELCCALRGLLHEYMFEKTEAIKWLFLDSDIMVFNSLDPIFQQLDRASIILTPHSTRPLDDNLVNPGEINFLISGIYNGGFLGLNKDINSQKFIAFFKNRLKDFSFNEYSGNPLSICPGIFVDQLWLNLVPLFFDRVELCSNAGANLGHWNLPERVLSKDDFGNIKVNSNLLMFTHFSGWDINNIEKVSKYAPMLDLGNTSSIWMEMGKDYKALLLESGYEEFMSYPYAFNYFNNGKLIDSRMRRKYYQFLQKNDGSISIERSPFDDDFYCYFESDRKLQEQNTSKAKKILNKLLRLVSK